MGDGGGVLVRVWAEMLLCVCAEWLGGTCSEKPLSMHREVTVVGWGLSERERVGRVVRAEEGEPHPS